MASTERIEGRSVGERGTATALHTLVWSRNHSALEKMLQCMPRTASGVVDGVNAKDEQGNTPIALAIQLGDHESVKILLEAGASVRQSARTADGWATHSEAARWRNRAMLRDIFTVSLKQIDLDWQSRSAKMLDALELVSVGMHAHAGGPSRLTSRATARTRSRAHCVSIHSLCPRSSRTSGCG